MNFETWHEQDTGTKRIGRPRKNWLHETQQDMWREARKDTAFSHTQLNVSLQTHRDTMKQYAHEVTVNKKTIS